MNLSNKDYRDLYGELAHLHADYDIGIKDYMVSEDGKFWITPWKNEFRGWMDIAGEVARMLIKLGWVWEGPFVNFQVSQPQEQDTAEGIPLMDNEFVLVWNLKYNRKELDND